MLRRFLFLTATLLVLAMPSAAQKKQNPKPTTRPPAKTATKPLSELDRLRDEFINATKEYKASLERLIPIYEKNLHAAEEKAGHSKELFAQGLISKRELEDSDRAVLEAKSKIDDVRNQMSGADSQIAQLLVEVESDKQMAKLKRLPKGGTVMTTSFVRFNGAGPWSIALAGSVDAFFRQKFGRPLPIAVLGQGAIHNQWRLDHHNAMDLSLNPSGAEGQAVMDYLRSRGIPFSAFRQAIPGTATGPHIHVGLPSHRY
ncbi:MAG TPA: TolC family protein [Pyrinomonadaceae bacterium]|nr:TolC family protein [Pyrinomonadaceae bacterium]